MPFVRLASESQLPPADEAKEFSCLEKSICIANVKGIYSAMDGICPHRGGPLGQGMIEGGKIVCPWHAWTWNPETGVADQTFGIRISVYPLKIEKGDVLIEI